MEQRRDLGPRKSVRARGPEGVLDRVGDVVANQIPEDLRRARLAEIPDRECRLKMRGIDRGLVVERGIDHREPYHLRLGSAENRAEQSRPLG